MNKESQNIEWKQSWWDGLVKLYGKSIEAKNLCRMMQLAELFPDFEIVDPLARQLSWSYFLTTSSTCANR